MEIIIHVHAKKLDKNLQLAVDEYVKRTSPFCRVNIKLYKSPDKMSFKTGSKVYNVLPGHNSPTSEGLSKLICDNNLAGISCIEFIILDRDLETAATKDGKCILPDYIATTEGFNLSSFLMSPQLTTVVLTEQIYRAYTIMNNITYHK